MSRRPAGQQEATTWRRDVPRDRRMEGLVALLLLAAGALAAAFAVLYILDASTQLLGLALGLAFACLAAALIVAGKRVVPQETAILSKPPLADARARFEARDVLADGLRTRGVEVDILALYRTVAEPLDDDARAAALGADYATFTSASSARFFHAAAGTLSGPRLVSIGPATSAAIRELGFAPDVEASDHTPDGLVAALLADASGTAAG
jgi:hypothetical protein